MKGVLSFPCKDRWYVSHTCTDTHSQYQSTIPAYQTARGQIAGQGDTHTVNDPCLPDCTRANRWSGRHAHAQTHTVNDPCLPDCTRANRRSGRYTHSQRSLPTRLHQGKSPVRETHTCITALNVCTLSPKNSRGAYKN